MRWGALWSSEAVRYGGRGVQEPESEHGWIVPGTCAILLAPEEEER